MNTFSATQEMNLVADSTLQRYPELAEDVRSVQHGVVTFEQKMLDTITTREYTPLGRLKIIDREASSRFEALHRSESKTLALGDEILRDENTELTLRPSPDGIGRIQVRPDRERSTEELTRETWVWNQVRSMKGHEAEQLYTNAISKGDYDMIEALERMPRAFSTLGQDAIDRGRRLKLELSPAKETLDKKREQLSVRRRIDEKARELMTGLVGHALQLATNSVQDELRRLDPGYDLDQLRRAENLRLTPEARALKDELAMLDDIRKKHPGK